MRGGWNRAMTHEEKRWIPEEARVVRLDSVESSGATAGAMSLNLVTASWIKMSIGRILGFH
jgi:hypothetical protein